jgi:hypothetical protein
MRRVRVVCKSCRFYKEEGIWFRCILESNLTSNWIGVVYKLHPTAKNLSGRCKDYEEIGSNDPSSSDDASGGMQNRSRHDH